MRTDLALIIEESTKKQINTYFNQDFYRLAYFPNNVIPYEKIDFKSHGLTNLIFEGDYPFIIDERNLNTNKGNRTFYTSNFILNYHNFPKKEEMDLINIKYKRDKIFEQLLYSLISFNNTYLTIKNPNETYYNPFELNLNKRFTIRSDGHSYLDNNEPLKPDKKYLESSKVIIENANFVLIAMITNNEINSLNLIISDSYYKYLLDNNLKIIEILNLIPKTKENIILNLNNF